MNLDVSSSKRLPDLESGVTARASAPGSASVCSGSVLQPAGCCEGEPSPNRWPHLPLWGMEFQRLSFLLIPQHLSPSSPNPYVPVVLSEERPSWAEEGQVFLAPWFIFNITVLTWTEGHMPRDL